MKLSKYACTQVFRSSALARALKVIQSALIMLALALTFGANPIAAQEKFNLSPQLNSELLQIKGGVLGPEGDWERRKSVLAGSAVIALTPNDQSANSSRIVETLKLTKDLFSETVLASGGQIEIWLDDGTLYAVEYDLFGIDDPVLAPSVSERLETVGSLSGIDGGGDPMTLGTMYCYNQSQFTARLAALSTVTGGSVSSETKLYPGPVIQAEGGGSFVLHIPGEGNQVTGDLLSNGGLRLSGKDNLIGGRMRASGAIQRSGTGHICGVEVIETESSPLAPLQRFATEYENLATANSTFFNSSITLVGDGAGGVETSLGVPVSGVVYAAGDITVEFSGLTVSLTLIAEGSIEFAGGNNNITSDTDDLLVWAIKDPSGNTDNDVVLSADDNTFAGVFYAPGGAVKLGGDTNDITGSIFAWKVVVDGEGHSIGDGTD